MLTKDDVQVIAEVVKDCLQGVETRLDRLETKVDRLETDVNGLKCRMDNLESKVEKIENDVKIIKVDMLENNVIPRLSTIEKCYVDTFERYKEGAEKFDTAIVDISVMKLAIQKNSEDIRELQRMQA